MFPATVASWTWLDELQKVSVDGVLHTLTYQFTSPSLDDLAGLVSDACARLEAHGLKTAETQTALAWDPVLEKGTYVVTFTTAK